MTNGPFVLDLFLICYFHCKLCMRHLWEVNTWPNSAGQITRNWCERSLKFFSWLRVYPSPSAAKETVKLVFYVLVCQVQEDTLLVLWHPVGDGMSFHTALQRRVLSKITTVKSVPAEECFEREAEEKGVLFKGGRKYSKVSVMFTANFECSLTGGKLQFGRLFVCFGFTLLHSLTT